MRSKTQFHHFTKKGLTSARYPVANERTYDRVMAALTNMAALLGASRADVTTLEPDHVEAKETSRSTFIPIERIGTKIFAALPTAKIDQSPIAKALPASVILGAFQKYQMSDIGCSLSLDLKRIEANNSMAFATSPTLQQQVKTERKAKAPPRIYALTDIYYKSANKLKETSHKIVEELYTICAVRKTILEYVHQAESLTVPKTKAYHNIATKIVPHAMNHNLLWTDMTEEQINDPKWVAEQVRRLDEASALLKNTFTPPGRRKHADKIAKTFSVGITKKYMEQLANG